MSKRGRTYPGAVRAEVIDQHVVAREENAYVGGVFEGGLWSLGGGSELLAGGIHRPCTYTRRSELTEAGVHSTPMSLRLWRSLDGGATWAESGTIYDGQSVADAIERSDTREAHLHELLQQNPKDLILSASTHVSQQNPRLILYASGDAGRTWIGPRWHRLSFTGASIREGWGQASSLRRQDGSWLLFLTSLSPYGTRRPFVAWAAPAGGRFVLLSLLPADPDFDHVWPSAAALPDGSIVAAVTRRRADSPGHTLIYRSEDGGRSWEFTTRATEIGQPADVLAMPDGRLLLTCGWPLPPYRLLARLSEDGGRSWGQPRILREGGGSADLGSARSVTGADGTVVTVYQWNDGGKAAAFHGGRRYIAATRWRP